MDTLSSNVIAKSRPPPKNLHREAKLYAWFLYIGAMKCLVLTLLLAFACFSSFAQRYYPSGVQSRTRVAVSFGSSTYMGDLQEDQLMATTPNAGLSYEYLLNRRWSLRADGLVYRLSASDANASDPGRYERNLSFFSTNYELSTSLMLYLFRQPPAAYSQRRPWNMYALLGFGATYYNPKTVYEGKTYQLREYRTEGVAYGKFSPVIPAGLGLSAKISERFDLALEATYRLTFTDYLDDVSGSYLAAHEYSSELAAALGDRRLNQGVEPSSPTLKRGNPALKDGYALYNLRVIYYLNIMYYSGKDKRKKLIR